MEDFIKPFKYEIALTTYGGKVFMDNQEFKIPEDIKVFCFYSTTKLTKAEVEERVKGTENIMIIDGDFKDATPVLTIEYLEKIITVEKNIYTLNS